MTLRGNMFRFPDPHVDFVSGNADMSSFLFRLSTVRPASAEYREMRPYMISTDVERVNPEDHVSLTLLILPAPRSNE